MNGLLKNGIATGDCVKRMRSLEPLSIDHGIHDPPYSDKVHSCSRRGLTNYKEIKGDAARTARNRDLGFEPMTPELMNACAEQFARITRRWVLVFCDLELAHEWRESLERAGMEYVRTLIWEKLGAAPQMTGDRPANHAEAIVLCHQTHPDGRPMKKRWRNGGNGNMYRFAIVLNRSGKDPRHHTTQKPLALMSALVRHFTDPGDVVLDAFAGSGTTILACRARGRVCYGIELDPEVATTGNERIRTTTDQAELPTFEITMPTQQSAMAGVLDFVPPTRGNTTETSRPNGPRETT